MFLSPSKICENLNFSREIQISANFAGWLERNLLCSKNYNFNQQTPYCHPTLLVYGTGLDYKTVFVYLHTEDSDFFFLLPKGNYSLVVLIFEQSVTKLFTIGFNFLNTYFFIKLLKIVTHKFSYLFMLIYRILYSSY